MAANRESLARHNALQAYNAAREQLSACLAALRKAQEAYPARPEQVRQCQLALEQAMESERAAFARVAPYLSLQVAPPAPAQSEGAKNG